MLKQEDISLHAIFVAKKVKTWFLENVIHMVWSDHDDPSIVERRLSTLVDSSKALFITNINCRPSRMSVFVMKKFAS